MNNVALFLILETIQGFWQEWDDTYPIAFQGGPLLPNIFLKDGNGAH